MLQVIKHYIPKLVDIHNYHQASSSSQKVENWKTLNTKARTAHAATTRLFRPLSRVVAYICLSLCALAS